MMRYPISLDLTSKKALVVGAGKIAQRKINYLLRAGAQVHVVATEFSYNSETQGKFTAIEDNYHSQYIEGAFLAIAATDKLSVNEQVKKDCQKASILFSCVDTSVASDFYVSAMIERGDLQICINTSGKVPGLSRAIKKKLDKNFKQEWAELIDYLSDKRAQLKQYPSSENYKKLIKQLSSNIVLDLFEKNGMTAVREHIEEMLADHV